MTNALKLSVYFGDSQLTGTELTSDALMDCFARRRVAASQLCRGIEGFGLNRRIHAEGFPDVSTDLPLVASAIDRRDRIEALLDEVDHVVADGLVTLEHAHLAVGDEVVGAELPHGGGQAGKLTLYCGRSERGRSGRHAHREVIDILRRHRTAAAIALLAVDGTYRGRRHRATLLSPRRRAPTVVVSVGRSEALRAALPELARALERPLAVLQTTAQLKHGGTRLEEPRPPGDSDRHGLDVWQAIHLYTRQSAQVNGRAIYTEVTQRLRKAGAAGVTTIRGLWGFVGEEPPYGDRLGRLASYAPTYTTYIDQPRMIAETWPIIDELTAEHGIVASLPVPAYRERRGRQVAGGLRLVELPHDGGEGG